MLSFSTNKTKHKKENQTNSLIPVRAIKLFFKLKTVYYSDKFCDFVRMVVHVICKTKTSSTPKVGLTVMVDICTNTQLTFLLIYA